jgi:hypothetical protein
MLMKLYDLAFVCRSKNAGPFQFTIDLMFQDAETWRRVLNAPLFRPETIAAAYQTDPAQVKIKPFERILTIKVVIPRACSSGAPEDRDVYGSQQHFPLGNLDIE